MKPSFYFLIGNLKIIIKWVKRDLSPSKFAVVKVMLEENNYIQTEIAHRVNSLQKSVNRPKETLDVNGIYESGCIGKYGRKKLQVEG